jgi:hypothetical protein
MLWRKSWWETRWLFLFGFGAIIFVIILTFAADYDAARWAARLQRGTGLSESEREALNNFQGRTWAIWFKLMLNFIWADYAVIAGALCLMTFYPWQPSQCAAGLFTLSLPVSRRKVLLSHGLVGFSELFLVGLSASILMPLIARFQGQWFSWKESLIYTMMMVFGGAIFFGFSFLLTVILGNSLVAFLLAEAVVFALVLPYQSFTPRPWWNILGVMAGESYFFHGQIPWLGLLISLALSGLFMLAAVRIFERRDL